MAVRRMKWTLPLTCALVTLCGMALGAVYDGAADWLAAALLVAPVAIGIRAARFV